MQDNEESLNDLIVPSYFSNPFFLTEVWGGGGGVEREYSFS